MAKTSVKAVPLSTVNSSSVTTSFVAINTTGLPAACFAMRVVNDSNKPIYLSYDGVTAHEYLADDSAFDIPVQTNAQPIAMEALFAKGLKVYVKGEAGTGLITLSAYYV